MLSIIVITLLAGLFLYWLMESRRRKRNEKNRQRKADAYDRLLRSLKKDDAKKEL